MNRIVELDQGQKHQNVDSANLISGSVDHTTEVTSHTKQGKLPITGYVDPISGSGHDIRTLVTIHTPDAKLPGLSEGSVAQLPNGDTVLLTGDTDHHDALFHVPADITTHIEPEPPHAEITHGTSDGSSDVRRIANEPVAHKETGETSEDILSEDGSDDPPGSHTHIETNDGEPPNYFPPGYDERMATINAAENAKLAELRGSNATNDQIIDETRVYSQQRTLLVSEADDHLRKLAQPYKNPPDTTLRVTTTEDTEEGARQINAAFTESELDGITKVRDVLEGPHGMIRVGMSGRYPERNIWFESLRFPRERVSDTTPSLTDRSRSVDGIFGLAREAQRAFREYGEDTFDPETAQGLRTIEMLPLILERHITDENEVGGEKLADKGHEAGAVTGVIDTPNIVFSRENRAEQGEVLARGTIGGTPPLEGDAASDSSDDGDLDRGDRGQERVFVISPKSSADWVSESKGDYHERNQIASDVVANTKEIAEPGVNWKEVLYHVRNVHGPQYRGEAAIAYSVATTIRAVAARMSWGMDSPPVVYMSASYISWSLGTDLDKITRGIADIENGDRKFQTQAQLTQALETELQRADRLATDRGRIGRGMREYANQNFPQGEQGAMYRKLLDALPFLDKQRISSDNRNRGLAKLKAGDIQASAAVLLDS